MSLSALVGVKTMIDRSNTVSVVSPFGGALLSLTSRIDLICTVVGQSKIPPFICSDLRFLPVLPISAAPVVGCFVLHIIVRS